MYFIIVSLVSLLGIIVSLLVLKEILLSLVKRYTISAWSLLLRK